MNIWSTLKWLAAAYLLGVILSHIKPIKIRIVKNAAAKMETKYQSCQKCGEIKKAKAIKRIRWLLLVVDKATTSLFDIVIKIANEKNTEMVESIKSVTPSEISVALKKRKEETI